MPNIVLTRPLGQSLRLGELLHRKFPTLAQIQLPLLSIVPNENPADAKRLKELLPTTDLAVFVSPNAVECSMRMLQTEWPKNLPIAVVGGGSLEALSHHGITAQHGYTIYAPSNPSEWDSEGLWKILNQAQASWAGKKILFLKGIGGRAWLGEQFLLQGAEIHSVATYKRMPLSNDAPAWLELKNTRPSDSMCVLTSSEAARHFAQYLKENTSWAGSWLNEAMMLCTHQRIAQVCRELGFKNVDWCAPGDDQLLVKIDQLHPNKN
jgi:uroporphyrinogen-III synthase